ncbi:hypothetical protein HMPREF0201_00994 [Cedecea davisae DSM 4568]|uniref:Uncharacterized protein n=1 Tax=Cedecea davisae DSM 4568 TaxID=566551 RepID=S3IZL6_9ENTR|nr:hypothetical protein HMPREF0201_00994 [Cedecea davisae DSM 4568]
MVVLLINRIKLLILSRINLKSTADFFHFTIDDFNSNKFFNSLIVSGYFYDLDCRGVVS